LDWLAFDHACEHRLFRWWTVLLRVVVLQLHPELLWRLIPLGVNLLLTNNLVGPPMDQFSESRV
jgi:hypothetical protein